MKKAITLEHQQRSDFFGPTDKVVRAAADGDVRLMTARYVGPPNDERIQLLDESLRPGHIIDPERLVFFMFQNVDLMRREARVEFEFLDEEGEINLDDDDLEPNVIDLTEVVSRDKNEVLENLMRPYAG